MPQYIQQLHQQIPQIWKYNRPIMRRQPSQYLQRLILDLEIRVVHAVEQHQQILPRSYIGIKLLVHVSQHCASDIQVWICGCHY